MTRSLYERFCSPVELEAKRLREMRPSDLKIEHGIVVGKLLVKDSEFREFVKRNPFPSDEKRLLMNDLRALSENVRLIKEIAKERGIKLF